MSLLHDAVLTKPTSYVTSPVSLRSDPMPTPSLPSTASTPGKVTSLSATLSVASTAFVTVPRLLSIRPGIAGRVRVRRYPSGGSDDQTGSIPETRGRPTSVAGVGTGQGAPVSREQAASMR